MSEPLEVVEAVSADPGAEPNPDNFAAWNEWREKGGGRIDDAEETSPADEKGPASEPPQEIEEGETAAESDPEEEEQQAEGEEEGEEELQEEAPPVRGEPGKGRDKRLRKLTGKIAALESQLAELTRPDVEEEVETEVASVPEPAAEAKAPELGDFEDTDTETSWQQYEKATRAFNKAETAKAIAAALAEQKQKLDLEHAAAETEKAWSQAAERYPDYDAVVKNDVVQISPAMIAVARADMDPETGTAVAYYLGQHPEEAKRIMEMTLANTEPEWQRARVRAGIELGKIASKIPALDKAAAPGPKLVAPKGPAPKPPAAPPITPKKTTTVSRPPTQLRGAPATQKFDLMDDSTATDTTKWIAERERQIAARAAKR